MVPLLTIGRNDHATTLEWCDSLLIIFYALCVLNNTMCAPWWPPRYCSARGTGMLARPGEAVWRDCIPGNIFIFFTKFWQLLF